MVVDTPALMAILRKELDCSEFFDALNSAPKRMMAAPNWLEACLVFGRRDAEYASRRLDVVVPDMRSDIIPSDSGMAEIGRFARRRDGMGSKHHAKLNFGGCIALARAKSSNQPLLFTGNDFPLTDFASAVV